MRVITPPVCPRYRLWKHGNSSLCSSRRTKKSKPAAGERQQNAFGQTRSNRTGAARAQSWTDREFMPAARRTRQKQIRDVCTGNQEHESHRRQQDEEHGLDIAHHALLERSKRNAYVLI